MLKPVAVSQSTDHDQPNLHLVVLNETSLTTPQGVGLSADLQLFRERCRLLGFTLKSEPNLSAIERIIPNFHGLPLRKDSETVLHLMHGEQQSGLYVRLSRVALPELDRIRAARALHSHLTEILAYTTADYPDVIQTAIFFEASTAAFDIIQYWIDYPGAKHYAYRVVSDDLAAVVEGMSHDHSVDLTRWSGRIARFIRPLLAELSVTPWQE